jgi:hypothetical protein
MSPAFGEDLVGLFLMSSGFPCQHCRFVLNACSYEQIRSRTFSETSSPRSSLEKVLFLHGPGDLRLSMQAPGSLECRTMWISGRTCVAFAPSQNPLFTKKPWAETVGTASLGDHSSCPVLSAYEKRQDIWEIAQIDDHSGRTTQSRFWPDNP